MLLPVPDRAPALFRAGDLGVSAEWRDISYDWSPLLTPDGVYIYSYLRDTYDQQRSRYPFLLVPEGPTKKKIQTRLGLRSAYAMHGPEFLLMTVGLLHVEVAYGQAADPERPHHTHVAYYVVGRLDHPVLEWATLERVLDALMIVLAPPDELAASGSRKQAEAALRALGQAGLLQDCDPQDLFYELGAWPTLLPTLVGDQRWAALFTQLHGAAAMQRYRRQARRWAEYAQRYVARLEQEHRSIRDQVLAAQRGGPRRLEAAVVTCGSRPADTAVTGAAAQILVTEPRTLTSRGSVTAESPASHRPAEVTSGAPVTAEDRADGSARGARLRLIEGESPPGDQLTNHSCRRGESTSIGDSLVGAHGGDSPDQLPPIEPHLRDAELGSSRFDAYFWCAVNEILHGSRERYAWSPGEKQAVFRQFKRQDVPVGVVLAALRASVEQLAPAERHTLADVLKTPLFHACVQRALALLPARVASSAEDHSWPAFLAAYRRLDHTQSLRDVSVPDYHVLHGLFMKQPDACWEVLSRVEHMADVPELSPRYLQRAIVNNQRAAAERALTPAPEAAPCRQAASRAWPATPEPNPAADPRRALLAQEGLKPQLLTGEMTEPFIQAWIGEADARRDAIRSRPRWLSWGLRSGCLPEDHPTLPPRAAAAGRGPAGANREPLAHVGAPLDPDHLWQRARAQLQHEIPDEAFVRWLATVELRAIVPDPAEPAHALAYLCREQRAAHDRSATEAGTDPHSVYGHAIEATLGAVCGCAVRLQYADEADQLPDDGVRGVELPSAAGGYAAANRTEALWTTVLATLERRLPRTEFETWIKATLLLDLVDGQAIVGTPNIFVREAIRVATSRCWSKP